MPTIPQLPPATTTAAQDELPVSQAGVTRSVSVSELLNGTQPAIELPPDTLLGRVSLGPGGPEPVNVGIGLAIGNGALSANGADHAQFAAASSLDTTNDAIINAAGVAQRLQLSLMRGLFSAGTNIGIDANGKISSATDPVVTSELGSLTTGLATTNSNLAALAARVPTGGYVALNDQGQMVDPVAGPVTLGTVSVGTGFPARTLGTRSLDTLNVLDFGAVTDGSDCSAAFNAAFAALSATGGEIFIPAGNYTITSSLTWSNKPVAVRGAGKGITRIHFAHTGVGFDISQASPFSKVVLRDFSAYAESQSGQTAAVARLTFPQVSAFGYVSAFISDVECFGYPNSANGNPPFPQTFLRGFVLSYCWSVQLNNISWFGPPAPAGSSNSAVVELNRAIDTRITGLQAYYGQTAVLQSGYCEGIYIFNPLVVGTDYVFTQTDITTWPGYTPTKLELLGLWICSGEVNTNIGTVRASNASIGFFTGLDITRDGGPNISQTFFNLTNVSSYWFFGCNFIGGPSGGNKQDIAISFKSTFNSSNNTIVGCEFQNLATILQIETQNATVGLTTLGINPGNVPLSTAFIDNSGSNVANYVSFKSPPQRNLPAGVGNTKDHVFSGPDGSPLVQISAIRTAANYLRMQAATPSNPPTIAFDGSDGQINGVIQTKGGNLYINAAGGSSGSGNLLSLLNMQGATAWPILQNATSGNLSLLTTNSGGLGIQPKGALWLSPGAGLFAPNLPTTRPTTGSGQLWNNNGVLSIA